jgi:hypothetical protein
VNDQPLAGIYDKVVMNTGNAETTCNLSRKSVNALPDVRVNTFANR